jgi:hypothetical protein
MFLLPAAGQLFQTKDEALESFFPGRTITRSTIFLTEEQRMEVQSRARVPVESRILTYYTAHGSDGIDGYAFFETDVVRTMPETYMVVIRPDSTVAGVEILAFYEPIDYLPGERWLGFFTGRQLTDELWVKRDIPNITGATLSTRAINQGVRRYLAMFERVVPKEKGR